MFHLQSGSCPFCGKLWLNSQQQQTTAFTTVFTTNTNNDNNSTTTPTQYWEERIRHLMECTLRAADEFKIDVSDLFSPEKQFFLKTVVNSDDENPLRLFEEHKYEYNDVVVDGDDDRNEDDKKEMEDDDDLEREINDLLNDEQHHEQLRNKVMEGSSSSSSEQEQLVMLKFKFMNGMIFEGSFDKTVTTISEIVEWLSIKSHFIKESIGLRFEKQLFENIKVLQNKSTLEELNIKNNAQLLCFIRQIE